MRIPQAMTLFSIKNKIFPLIVLLLATTLSSFSGLKKIAIEEGLRISKQSESKQSNSADAETPQSTEEQENDDKVEDADDPFIIGYFIALQINHQVNHIQEFQIALYREHHQVIITPPPEA